MDTANSNFSINGSYVTSAEYTRDTNYIESRITRERP